MLRRRILNFSALPLTHQLLTPSLYYSVASATYSRTRRLFALSLLTFETSTSIVNSAVSARRFHHTSFTFDTSTLLRSSKSSSFGGGNNSVGGFMTSSQREPPTQCTMSHDGVDVPCSTQLTIGDVVIPVPDYAVHPERVTWATPGVDHSAPYLLQAPVHAFDNIEKGVKGGRAALPSLQGDGQGEENVFFSVQDPLTRSYLRWIAQKEQLGQDMCLVGDPGPAMRWLVMLYSHLTRREIRVVYLNSDVTESDLKQRREIRNGCLIYDDQSAVSAAVEGQLLVLEGLERVERNVLPVVNNLLENREMHLDNGSVLIHPARYDSLLQKLYESKLKQHRGSEGGGEFGAVQRAALIAEAKCELAQMGLVRVSEKFRVIGITVPVPPYEGNPLDPPLRSRFQCLYVRTPLPVVAPSSSVINALQTQSNTHAGRKRSKRVVELQELQSVRFGQVAQLRAALTAINDSTRDFQLCRPSKKTNTQTGSRSASGQSQSGHSRFLYDSNDVVAELFGDESENGGSNNEKKSETRSGSAIPLVSSSPLQTIGHWALATIAQQLALFPDLPLGEAIVRGFPWVYYARQLTCSGAGGAATGYATVEEYRCRLRQYAEVLRHCHVYPPLLLAVDLSSNSGSDGVYQAQRGGHSASSASTEPAARSSRVSARLRTVVQGQGVDAGSDEAPGAAAARAYIRSAQLVATFSSSSLSDPPHHVSVVPPLVQRTCNYILQFRKVSSTAEFSGVPVVAAEAVVATAAHDAEHPGEAGTYTLPVFLGVTALPADKTVQAAWERNVEEYLAFTASPGTIFTTEHFHVLQTMLQIHASRQHMCLLGPTGCGKTTMVRAFGRLLGYEEILTMHLYADMTNKDLFQQRMTDPTTGNTTWQNSPLLYAAIYGKLVVLDGLEKLPNGMLSSLQQLLVDQSAVLADGTILKPPTEYILLKEQLVQRDAQTGEIVWQPTDADMRDRKIFPVHPAFRVVATARPPLPVSGGGGGGGGGSRSGKNFFITHDLTLLFRTVAMPDAGDDALGPVLRQVAKAEIRTVQMEAWRAAEDATEVRRRSEAVVEKLLQLRDELEELHAADGKMPQLSLRQLRQLVRSAVRYPLRVEESVRNTLLLPLMTGVAATKVRHALESCGLAGTDAAAGGKGGVATARRTNAGYEVLSQAPTSASDTTAKPSASVSVHVDRAWQVNGEPVLKLTRVYTQTELALVPFVTGFHANDVHESILAWLAMQYAMRNSVLLIGSQGVGKNKVVDAFLSRLGIPRHYIQLHRDTTVGSLTINPTVEAGRVVWEDSPLVKAVQQGHCLVVDEIDKAPVEVVQVLKGLIEDREMRLGDGRQIYDPALEHQLQRRQQFPQGTKSTNEEKREGSRSAATQRIAIHPDFRIIVLANPPGFPFHGNDFFRECGDLFAAYVMSNPDAESQLSVLTAYAPTLPRALLERLVAAFIQLQSAFAQGNLTYPFSLRELIAVVKHMSRYPQDGVYGALNNVFNFDARDESTLRLVRQVLTHYLQPMIQQGGLQCLRPYRAGQPVPLMPFKSLVSLPLPTANSASNASKFLSLVTLSAEVVTDARDILARIAQIEKERHGSVPPSWTATYPAESFSSLSSGHSQQSAAFTEWVSQCRLPFVDPQTDTVLAISSVNALGGTDEAGSEATLPLISVLLLRASPSVRDTAEPNPMPATSASSLSTAASAVSSPARHRLIVATVRLPPSSLDVRHLIADAAEEIATLWPVGHVRFVDVSAYYTAELSRETVPSFTFAGLRMTTQHLPWTTAANPPDIGVRESVANAVDRDSYTWPPSLAACSSSSWGFPHTTRYSFIQQLDSADAVRERTPQAILLLSSLSTGFTVLLDVLAGSASDLYLTRMGFGSGRVAVHTIQDVSSTVKKDVTDKRTAPRLGPALPLHLDQLFELGAKSEHNGVADVTVTDSFPMRVLDVRASHGIVAFTAATPSPSCCFLIAGHLVRVTFPQPIVSLRFVGETMAVVEMIDTASEDAATGALSSKRGVLKVTLTADGMAQASFLPLPPGTEQMELVELGVAASSATSHASGSLVTPSDLANSVWRRSVSDGSAVQLSVVQPATKGSDATVTEVDDPTARDIVYARAEGVTADGLQLRYYKNASASAKLPSVSSRVVVDDARHQLLQVLPDGQTVMAVDTQHGTLRSFAPLSGVSFSDSTAAPSTQLQSQLSVDNRSGTAYTWDSATQQLSIADLDAERVRQRYAEWSSLLSGNATSVGDAATVEEGEEDVKDFKMKYSQPRKQPSGTLKHGEVDDKEHHGGSTWAGGTGGTDTAGLGGMVGPYRLDKGNAVYQVPPEEKRKVPKHLLEEARRMGREALKERLESIGMTETEYEEYKRLQERVQPAVAQLRTLLMGLRAAEGERMWATGQTDGVWDDKKLVEGIVGEKNVYKRRVDSKEANPFQQKYKKRLAFVLDVSASMYRFNGMDQRLTKLLETAVMVMEAFAGFESKLDYAMIGHNGDSDNIPLVNFGAPPANQKERMTICLKMIAYAQYCWSGDSTVEAMRRSVELVTKEKGDSYFVFVVSDANLQRYGITPRELTEIIRSKPEVKMFCIFIATLGAQASHLQQQLPAGHGYECMRTDALPQVMRQIFTSANVI